MHLLSIETSSPRGSLALFEDGACVRESHFPEGLLHGREITARLDEMLRLEGLGPRSLGAIAVSRGPGSYTGIRVGVTAAKTLAYALGIPVVTESSLMVLAANAIPPEGTEVAHVIPTLDGRQGCLFWGLFSVNGRPGLPTEDSIVRLSPDKASDTAEILAALEARQDGADSPRVLALGEGADFFIEIVNSSLVERGPRSADVPSAKVLGALTWKRAVAASFDLEETHRLEPSYLRVTEAERRLAAKGGR